MALAALMLWMVTGVGTAQGAADPAAEQAAIRQAVLDYAEGYYDHAPERMTRAISPLLTKRALMSRPGVPAFLLQMNAEMLIEATRGSAPRPAAADRHMVVEVLDVNGDIASARVFSVLFNDYVHLVKRDGRWTLLNVLWHAPLPSPAATAAIAPAIEQASRDYATALAGTDGQRALAVLSPVAAIRALVGAPSGARVIRDQNTESMAAAITSGQLPKGAAAPEVAMLGADGDIASVKLGTGASTTYLHLALQNGKWIVVNTLTSVGPR